MLTPGFYVVAELPAQRPLVPGMEGSLDRIASGHRRNMQRSRIIQYYRELGLTLGSLLDEKTG